jgi:hypothetical protein
MKGRNGLLAHRHPLAREETRARRVRTALLTSSASLALLFSASHRTKQSTHGAGTMDIAISFCARDFKIESTTSCSYGKGGGREVKCGERGSGRGMTV